MPDPNQGIASSATGEPLVYRPVSLLAIVGACLGGLYTALVLLTTIVALINGTPYFLRGWLVILVLGGVVLSLLAMWQIRQSEGTLAGQAVARWGLWLSLVPGLGYEAYRYATGWALTQQANDFLMLKSD